MDHLYARLYELAKVYKKDTPIRPVLSLLGSFFENLNELLAKNFKEILVANIDSRTEEAKDMIENTN